MAKEGTKEERAARKLAKKEKKAASSLSSFLLAEANDKDDDIFANSKGPSVVLAEEKARAKLARKERKTVNPPSPSPPPPAAVVAEDAIDNEADLSELDSDAEISGLDDDEEEDDDVGVEEAYAARQAAQRLKALAEGGNKKRKAAGSDSEPEDEEEAQDGEEQGGSDSDDELNVAALTRTMLRPATEKEQAKAQKKEKKKEKTLAHADEPQEVRDQRTVFLGNVPVGCSTSRPMKKALLRHVLHSPELLSLLPAPQSAPTDTPSSLLRAESIRFRSLAFASTIFGRKAEAGTVVPPVAHARQRARDWRDSESTDARGVRGGFREKESDRSTSGGSGSGSKTPLTDGQKRKVAFIKGEVNEGKKVCNAYLVLSPLDPLPPGIASMSALVDLVVSSVDGTSFQSHTLRADKVRPKSVAVIELAQSANSRLKEGATDNAAPTYSVPPAEARRTLFMGGLDFAETEENVRAATEAVLVRERGSAAAAVGGSWVEGVRLIRDASTGLGKGFGYVLLRDAECVDELLALPFGQPLKVSKRKPRLERCKSGVAAARAKAASLASRAASTLTNISGAPLDPSKSSSTTKPGGGPRKDREGPSAPKRPRMSVSASEHQTKLADALAKLPVSERKAIKAVDPERLWRRAEKKKNKVLAERYERKRANGSTKDAILGRETRAEVRKRQEKKRVKAGNKTGKRAKI